jgi:chemotaxis protein MotB
MADEVAAEEQKCPECPPGLPGWMATFSDLVTLLLTFFVLLLSFAKTESAKYEAALGSIRNAFGGNVLKFGEVIQKGTSPDNSPTMLDSQEPIKPFPIEFLTAEGFLDKEEINRESDEDLKQMKTNLLSYELSDDVTIYEMPEGIKVRLNDRIYFKKGTTEAVDLNFPVFKKLTKMIGNENWVIFVEGHASRGESYLGQPDKDALDLSADRAKGVARSLIAQGVSSDRVTIVFYGDSKPLKLTGGGAEAEPQKKNRRVEFLIRKRDLRSEGHKVPSL